MFVLYNIICKSGCNCRQIILYLIIVNVPNGLTKFSKRFIKVEVERDAHVCRTEVYVLLVAHI